MNIYYEKFRVLCPPSPLLAIIYIIMYIKTHTHIKKWTHTHIYIYIYIKCAQSNKISPIDGYGVLGMATI